MNLQRDSSKIGKHFKLFDLRSFSAVFWRKNKNAKSRENNGVQGGIIVHKTAYVACESINAIHNGGYIQP